MPLGDRFLHMSHEGHFEVQGDSEVCNVVSLLVMANIEGQGLGRLASTICKWFFEGSSSIHASGTRHQLKGVGLADSGRFFVRMP